MAEITSAEFNNEEVMKFLKGMKTRLKNVKNGNKKYVGLLSAIIVSDVTHHFEQQHGSDGPWKQWSKSYKEHMNEIGKGGNKILQDTARLKKSFLPGNYRAVSAGILWYNNAKTRAGFPYAHAHDEGGPQLPKRDFMWASDEAIDKIGTQTLKFMIDEGV